MRPVLSHILHNQGHSPQAERQGGSPAVLRHFRPDLIGGKAPALLESGDLDQFAALLAPHIRPLPPASSYCGLFHPFQTNKRQMPPTNPPLIIVEDVNAAGANRIARDLAKGLQQRGIPIHYVSFNRSPAWLREADGRHVSIHELNKLGRHALLLLFSDVSGMLRPRQRLEFEQLYRQGRTVLMELREPRLWDGNTRLAAGLGFAVYPADSTGLRQAFRHFTQSSQHPADKPYPVQKHKKQAFSIGSTSLDARISRILGDAQGWAQICAMLPPPLGLGLAHQLRKHFYPRLPATAVNRLYALPHTRQHGGALYFSVPVLALLRAGFGRRERAQQEEILDYLLDRIAAAEPSAQTSLEHLEWQWYRCRLQLEKNPDKALSQLQNLARHDELNRLIRDDLALISVSSSVSSSFKAPLCNKPQERASLMILAHLAPSCGVSYAERHPWRYRFRYWYDAVRNWFNYPEYIAAFAPDNEWILCAGANNQAWLWHYSSGKKHLLSGADGFADHLNLWCRIAPVSKPLGDFYPDGRHVLTALYDNCVRVWETEQAELMYILKDHAICLRGSAFAPDGEKLYAVTGEGLIWDLSKGKILMRLQGHERMINSLALSSDGRYFLTASADHTARLWNAATGDLIKVFKGHKGAVNSARFAPGGKHIITASADKTARIWLLNKAKTVRLLRGHTKALNHAEISPDERFAVTASADRSARLWECASGKNLQTFKVHKSAVNRAAFSPDGRKILTAGDDYAVHVWEAVKNQ